MKNDALTPNQTAALGHLRKTDAPFCAADLASAMGSTKPSATATLATLSAKHAVERVDGGFVISAAYLAAPQRTRQGFYTYRATLPDGRVVQRRTKRTYSHVVAVFCESWNEDEPSWGQAGFCGRFDLAEKKVAELRRRDPKGEIWTEIQIVEAY